MTARVRGGLLGGGARRGIRGGLEDTGQIDWGRGRLTGVGGQYKHHDNVRPNFQCSRTEALEGTSDEEERTKTE